MISQEVQSKFVKNILENQEVKDAKFKVYVKDLIKIENIVLAGGPRTKMGGIGFYFLRTKYKNEYLSILRELNPQDKYSVAIE